MLYQKNFMEQMPNEVIMNDYYMIFNDPQDDVEEEEIYIEDED
jgi:hypothetical protein